MTIKRTSGTIKSTIVLMILTLCSRAFGFLRDMVLAYKYGANYLSDAYVISLIIPTMILGGVASALAISYMPVLSDVYHNNPRNLKKFNSNVITILAVLTVVITVIYFIFERPIIKIFASGFDEITFNTTVNLTRIMILIIFFMSASKVFQGFLQYHEKFYLVNFCDGIVINVFMILGVLLSTVNSPHVMSTGVLTGYIVSTLALIPAAVKFGFSYKPYIDVTDNSLKQMIGLIIPIFIGQTVFQLNTVVDKSLASNLPTGTVTALNYAFKLNDFFVSILIMSIATVIYPKLNKYAAENNIKALKHTLYTSLARPSVVLVPCMVGVIVLARPIVKVLYGRGAFDAEDIELTAQCLVFYSVGMVTVGFRQILNKVFYSLRDSKTPMINGAIAVVLNIGLNLLLIGPLKHRGLALATSISSLFTVVLLFISLRKKIGRLGIRGLIVNLFKMFISAGVMGIVIYFVNAKLTEVMADTLFFTILNIAITTVIGMIVYFICAMFLGVQSAPPKKRIRKGDNNG